MYQKAFYQKLIERFVNNTASEDELELMFTFLEDGEFTQVLSSYMDEDLKGKLLQARETKIIPIKKSSYKWLAIAASLLLICSISIYLFYPKQANKQVAKIENQKSVIQPGGNQALLTLSNGKQIVLANQKEGLLTDQAGIQVYKSKDGMLVYKMAKGIGLKAQTEFNTISTPKGGQYQVILEDGSKIWLNAASSIKLPTSFGDHSREIEITGEVYCEVAKDKKRPFRVITNKQVVEVLGTHFVVNAYPEEKFIKTTLVEGSVKVENTGSKAFKIIKSGDQAQIQNNGNQNINVLQVDTQYETAWKDGFFMFQHKPLENIMQEIARWYNVEVVYNGAIPEATFGGKISKFEDVQKILDILSDASEVKFKTEGRRIIVMN
jgi:transmembrane sensor